jgi:tRNA threonylcarbamoyladenosine biosynthesis protein TsaE
MSTKTILTSSEAETTTVGRELAAGLSAGSVILLVGDLGAGKTAFVRGLAEGLGIPAEDVSSPTFTIMQEYRGGRLPLYHVDLYRLDDPREIEDLGLDEIADGAVLAIEWAEKLRDVQNGAIGVRITHGDGDVRAVEITNSPIHQFTNYSDL